MINLNRILLPTDFSEYAGTASNYACALTEQFGSELHVVQDLVAMVPEPGLAFPPPGDYMGELQESAEKALDQMEDDLEILHLKAGVRDAGHDADRGFAVLQSDAAVAGAPMVRTQAVIGNRRGCGDGEKRIHVSQDSG